MDSRYDFDSHILHSPDEDIRPPFRVGVPLFVGFILVCIEVLCSIRLGWGPRVFAFRIVFRAAAVRDAFDLGLFFLHERSLVLLEFLVMLKSGDSGRVSLD